MARRRCPGRGRGCGATHFAMAKFSSENISTHRSFSEW
jgi:hypothetical protein